MANTRTNARLNRLWDRVLGNPVRNETTGRSSAPMNRQQRYVIEKGAEDPWTFLTSRDPATNRPLIWTKDEADDKAPLKPFPEHLDYVREYMRVLDAERFVLVDKARQMYVTTSTMLYIHWYCLYRSSRRCLLSKSTEKEAKEIIRDKVRFVHRQMPLWAQAALPISRMPQRMVSYLRTESVLIGVAQNVAETEGRGGTASIMLIDEAARQQKLEAILGGTLPMAGRVFATTTPDIGTPGATTFKEYLDDFDHEEEEEAI